jgi:hypothetical protein
MSIWSQLEHDSRTDIQLLNRAMALLYVIQSDPRTEPYMVEHIEQLEHELKCHRKLDARFNSCAVAFDLNKLHEEK